VSGLMALALVCKELWELVSGMEGAVDGKSISCIIILVLVRWGMLAQARQLQMQQMAEMEMEKKD
ncbi:unnamed protein product, partial [Symbiodinium pilosum]